ncbi:hypothetical protein [Nibricoccus sp. IMCC34717]|uniref:hypothetical protein n=1 Tax=Nibricoccus sp. IMCC34717 TaxID=3034021 RepID=UPI00384EC592
MPQSRIQPRPPALRDFDPGSIRGEPGFFRVGRSRGGRWWLIDPFDNAVVLRSVAGVRPLPSEAPGEVWLRGAVQQLRSWNFTTLGAASRSVLEGSGLYEVATVGFKRCGPHLRLGDMLLPDVFDPAWIRAVDERAREVCADGIARRDLAGYFTDDGLGWAQPDAEPRSRRPTLLQLCLSLEPPHRAFHAAWEFVLAPRRGDLQQLARDWGVTLPTQGALRQLTTEDVALDSPAYLQDHYTFTREFSRRYHATTAAAIRAHDPNHLVLGARWEGFPGGAVLQEAGYPHSDCLSVSGEDPAGWGALLAKLGGAPTLLVRVRWRGVHDPHEPMLALAASNFERRLREGCAALQELASHPQFVGYEWAAWADETATGPYDGSGLVRGHGEPPRDQGALLGALNGRLELWRCGRVP